MTKFLVLYKSSATAAEQMAASDPAAAQEAMGLWMAWMEKAEAAHVDMDAKTEGYTPDQRFWIAYAQQWCTQTRPEQLRTQAQTNPHAPDEYRTNTVLQDLPEFAKSFSCKKDAKMVIEKPCRVW